MSNWPEINELCIQLTVLVLNVVLNRFDEPQQWNGAQCITANSEKKKVHRIADDVKRLCGDN